ncbi:MAG: uroporphyrinogen-III synthase [Limisphaerales bacterium]
MLNVPVIKLVPPLQKDAIVDCLLELNSYDWLVFTSANGVTAFFDIFFRRFRICATSAGRTLRRSAQPRQRSCANCTCRWI